MKRRQNLEGSYYEKEGSYFYQFPRQAGTTYRPTVSGKTKKIRDARKREKELQLAANLLSPDSTLNQFLDKYMRDTETDIAQGRGRIRGTTHRRDRNCFAPLRKLLGETKLSQLKLRQIEQAYRDARTNQGKPFAPASIQRMHAVLHGALDKAVAWEMLTKNPAAGAKLPKLAKQEMLYLTLDEVHALIALDDRLHALWYLLVFTGLRQGEARALRWEDFNGHELDINGTLVPNYGQGGQVRNPVKTADGNRTVPIDPDLAAALAQHRTAQKREKLAAGPLWVETGYIFTYTNGQPYHGSDLDQAWKTVRAQVTDKEVRLHGTRHTAAYLHMNHLGTSDFELSKLLGHSSPTITYRNYAHFRQERATETAHKMGALLRGEG